MTLFPTDQLSAPPAPPIRKIDHPRAEQLAREWMCLLAPVCARVEIAGSVRRRKEQVNDLELVCIESHPGSVMGKLYAYAETRYFQKKQFFVRAGKKYVRINDIQSEDCRHGFRTSAGPGTAADITVPIDIFITTPEQWGYTLFIRTGSHEWNIAAMQRFHQLKLTAENCTICRGSTLLPTAEEMDIFTALGIGWVDPRHRIDGTSLDKAVFYADRRNSSPSPTTINPILT
jgi:DNA polymerase/3'-5' exonuclease PolX